MTIEIPRAVVGAMQAHARETYPDECCGFLIGRGSDSRRVVESRRAKNVATENRPRRYEIDPLELLHADGYARQQRLDVVGIYHSHPDHPAAPSEFDRARATGWYTYVILAVRRGQPGDITAWIFDHGTHTFHAEGLRIV